MKFKIITLGCKVNTYESIAMKELLVVHKYEETFEDDANIVIVNKCLARQSCIGCDYLDKECCCEFDKDLFPKDDPMAVRNSLDKTQLILANIIQKECSKYYECEAGRCPYYDGENCITAIWIRRYIETIV